MTRALVTGGAGFVGTNLADRLLGEGHRVVVLDDLSRQGVRRNLRWLRARHGDRLDVHVADVADRPRMRRALRDVDRVYHLAAQVAVTTSLVDPAADAHANIMGTLALLEELRRLDAPPSLLFTSTNKVYGNLDDVELVEVATRYEPAERAVRDHGVGEARPLRFCTPYGCSKGAADQYVLDYAHSFGLTAAVLRMSCIYGPHQCGNEDQGWLAHFLIRALAGEPITVFGDGKQVRDVLFVDDLVDALVIAGEQAPLLRGRAFNMGGGPENSVSLREVLDAMGHLDGHPPEVEFADWRPGDQRYYVSDTSAFTAVTGWRPRVPALEGLARLHAWLGARRNRRDAVSAAPAVA
ncbi:MAG: NAD-dependent epimerase/dehydratase family protein [Actinomycetota bacterium]|nr:NAD-dependent epimerase/dehydratase family protein [Actinomycetota bacterium]